MLLLGGELRGPLDDTALEFVLRVIEGHLGDAAVGGVAQHQYGATRSATPVAQGRDPAVIVTAVALPVLEGGFAIVAGFTVEQEEPRVAGEDRRERLAQSGLKGHVEQLFSSRIDVRGPLHGIEHHEGVAHVLRHELARDRGHVEQLVADETPVEDHPDPCEQHGGQIDRGFALRGDVDEV